LAFVLSIKEKVFLGISTSLLGFTVKTFLNLAVIPLIIAKMGAIQYGLYMLLFSFVEILADFASSVTNGLAFRLAQTLTSQSMSMHQALLRLSFWLHLLGAGLVLLAGFVAAPFLVNVISWPLTLHHDRYLLIYLTFFEGAIFLLAGYFRASLSAHTRMGVNFVVDMLQSVAINLTIMALLMGHYDFISLILTRSIISLLGLISLGLLSKKECQQLVNWSLTEIRQPEFCAFWHICWVNTAIMLISMVANRFDNLIIATYLSLGTVAAFSVVSRIYGQTIFLSERVATVLMPVMTRYASENRHNELKSFFLRSSQGLCFFSAFLLLWVTWFFIPLFNLLGQHKLNLAQVYPLSWVFIPYVLFFTMATPAASLLYSKNQFKPLLKWSALGAIINLALSLILVNLLGVIGPLLGTLCGTLIERLGFVLPRACQLLDMSVATFFKSVFIKNIPALMLAVGVFSLFEWIAPSWPALNRFFGSGFVAFALAALLWMKQNLSPQEITMVLARLHIKKA
jgi:O-antigen/teichoic acid export membrane protein